MYTTHFSKVIKCELYYKVFVLVPKNNLYLRMRSCGK
jgi:hypothetical protein